MQGQAVHSAMLTVNAASRSVQPHPRNALATFACLSPILQEALPPCRSTALRAGRQRFKVPHNRVLADRASKSSKTLKRPVT
jgi:hypothetical protein